jgi:DNA-binding NtrC family response regulator
MEQEEHPEILIVEDDRDTARMMQRLLEKQGCQVTLAHSGEEALDSLGLNGSDKGNEELLSSTSNPTFDLIILDLKLPGLNGHTVCQMIKEDARLKFTPIIMMTAHNSIGGEIQGLDMGADDYILKPFEHETLLARVRVMLRIRKLYDELRREKRVNTSLRSAIDIRKDLSRTMGRSQKMQAIYDILTEVSQSDSTVLIQGETGTGKELIANKIHQYSPRRDRPFVVVNCSAYPEGLLQSELFGHERGAFTGAIKQKLGRFELAHGGTIFLDEIGDITPMTQLLLLRVLQEKRFERLGSERTLEVDIRCVAATNRNLERAVEKGTFREDLYYRLNVISIGLPPLRERKEDVPLLCNLFLRELGEEAGKKIHGFGEEALALLMAHDWPGNVRELKNVLEEAIVLTRNTLIQTENLLPKLRDRSLDWGEPSEALSEVEKTHIVNVLESCQWNKYLTAKRLKISRSTLYGKLQRYGIRLPDDAG